MAEPKQHEARPIVVYDGECGMCRRAVCWLWRRARDRFDYVPYQDYRFGDSEPTREQCEQAVQLVEPDGRVRSAAAACFGMLEGLPRWRWAARIHRHVPGFAWLAEVVYRAVARNRTPIGKVLTKLFGPAPDGPPSCTDGEGGSGRGQHGCAGR